MTRAQVVLVGAGFVAGCALSTLLYVSFFRGQSDMVTPLRESALNGDSPYKFIDPLIGASGVNPQDSSEYQPLENTLRTYISTQIEQGNLSTASVVVSDISKALGFTINPNEQYNPASLLKVPTMIAYYKLAENDPSVLSKSLLFAGSTDANLQEHFQSPIQLQPGRSYTVDELIQHTIDYSDNNAVNLLINNLNATNKQDVFNSLFNDMGITNIDLQNDSITVNAYALFFRILYNATYLNRDMSEKALQLLTKTDFSKGIESGVPNNVQVAQKFGEYTLETSGGQVVKRELHNCGIVYYPGHPYLLCIMTKGNDFTKLEAVLSEVSHQTYSFMEQKYSQ